MLIQPWRLAALRSRRFHGTGGLFTAARWVMAVSRGRSGNAASVTERNSSRWASMASFFWRVLAHASVITYHGPPAPATGGTSKLTVSVVRGHRLRSDLVVSSCRGDGRPRWT